MAPSWPCGCSARRHLGTGTGPSCAPWKSRWAPNGPELWPRTPAPDTGPEPLPRSPEIVFPRALFWRLAHRVTHIPRARFGPLPLQLLFGPGAYGVAHIPHTEVSFGREFQRGKQVASYAARSAQAGNKAKDCSTSVCEVIALTILRPSVQMTMLRLASQRLKRLS